ncbi:diguanylate cyclase [Solihabitans fulvus]|uniref:Diguanylate cyclase n=1 Tax=Solihabitans fulvus TaxID=1892852 RepID=A0A5B2XDX3_9PSEU|nr:diguanylate cyclase [Solihabitans fulvus]KAA2261354.1 diguanylate cyclase [Solihabitans fulvus]
MGGPRARTSDRVWLVYLLCGLFLVGCYYLVPAHDAGLVLRVVLYCATSASGAAAILYGVRRNRPRPRLPWLLLGVSQLVYAAGDTSFYVSHYVFGATTFPSIADALYLAHYPLVVAALTLLIRRRTPGRDLPGILDAAVLTVVAGMLSWLFLIGPQARSDAPFLAKVASAGYPMMDLAMLTVALRLILGGGRRPVSFVLLSANLAAFLVVDTLYVLQQLAGTYHAGNFLDAIWLSGNLALGAAALHPTMSRLGDRSPVRDASLGPVRLTALSAAVLIAPATLLIQDACGAVREIPVIAGACAVLFVLAIARLAGLVADQRRLAITDSLTGLRTRRFFEARLPVELARARRTNGSLALFIVDVDRFKSINDRYGHPAGDQVLVEIAARLRGAARAEDVLARYGGEEFALLVPDTSQDELPGIAERLRHRVARGPIAVAQDYWVAVTVSVGTASFPEHGVSPSELVATADRALYAAKAAGRDRIVVGDGPTGDAAADGHSPLVDYLCGVADEVDGRLSSYDHSRAIGRWTMRLARELGHDDGVVRCAEWSGRLHDIGKIVLPEEVLTKPAALSEEEWRLVRQHPDHGYRLARLVPGFGGVAQVIRQHHERFDGTGYPDRLVGKGIRVEARILAVCDAWAAMLSDRPYQPSMTDEQARDELRKGRGSQFDPDAVDLFLDLHERGLVGQLRLIRPVVLEP